MNREFAYSLKLRQFNNPKPVALLRFQENETIDMFDRVYIVHNSSFRFVEWTNMDHIGSLIRDDRHVNKYARGPAKVIELGKVN